MPRLILRFKDQTLNSYPLTTNKALTIGRLPENDIAIDNLAVSGTHAQIGQEEGTFRIIDLQSKNGTFLNGDLITNSAIEHKDTITIGKHTLIADLMDDIDTDGKADAQTASHTEAPKAIRTEQTMFLDTSHGRQMRGEEPPPAPQPEPERPDADCLSFLTGGDGELMLTQKEMTIGKNQDADIIVSGFWGLWVGSPAVAITKQAGDYLLRYCGGLIKPKLNGSSVRGTAKLNHEDIIALGPLKVQIQLRERVESA